MTTRRTNAILDDFAHIRDHATVGTIEEAAELLGLKWRTLEKILERARGRGDIRGAYALMGIRKPRDPKWVQVIDTYKEGVSMGASREQIAKQLGISVGALSAHLSRARRRGLLPPVPTGRPPVMPDRFVLEEWETYQYSMTEAEFARRFGLDIERVKSLTS